MAFFHYESFLISESQLSSSSVKGFYPSSDKAFSLFFPIFCQSISPIPVEKTNLSVGVDLGIKHFATLSNGEVFDVPKDYKQIKAKIAKLQYLNRHKLKSSANWKKANRKIARLYYRLSSLR